MIYKALLLTLALIVQSVSALAKPVQVGEEEFYLNLGPFVQVLEDPSGELTLAEVQSPARQDSFVYDDNGDLYFGFSRSAYWLRFTLINASQQARALYLQVTNPLLGSVELFEPAGDDYRHYLLGDRYPSSQLAIGNNNIVFPLSIPATTSRIYLLRIKSHSILMVPLFISSVEKYNEYQQNSFLRLGLFYGLISGLLIYNLLIYLGPSYITGIRRASYLYYIIFILSTLSFHISLDGLGKYFWPESTGWVSVLYSSIGLTVFACAQFARSILDLQHYSRKLDIVLLLTAATGLLITVLVWVWGVEWIAPIALAVIVPAIFFIMLAGIVRWYRGYRPARYFMLAWIGYLLAAALYDLSAMGVLDFNQPTAQVLTKIGTVVQALFLSLALSDHINTLNQMLKKEINEREQAQQELTLLNEELEERVRRRTQELRQSKEEMQNTMYRLRKLDKIKSDFLSSVSHELRTPLTSIRGFAKLIGRDFERTFLSIISHDAKLQRKAERINENLNIILSESERLTRLINDVLDLAKIESGRMTWNDELLDLGDLIQQALHAAHGQFEAKPEVKLLTDITGELPKVICDRDRLIQVLVNLLNNAAKFTEQGQITLRAYTDGRGWANIQIIDTGSGFNPVEAESIFDKFKQASHGDTSTDKPKGTGLGLSISREIVRHYNGDITATSELGVGSTFTITLPAVTLPSAGKKELPLEEFSDTTVPLILAVDDDPAVCRYLTQLFQENHYRVITANNGKTALENAHTHHPDLIIMDLAMPIMDGREAIELLRADPLLNAIPVIVVTAMPNKETPGADVAFSKPIDEHQLLSGVRLLLGRTEKSPAELRCLVVYDTPKPPERTPEIFDHLDYCPFNCLQEKIEQGYKGIVMLPSYLLKKIDLDTLQMRSKNQIMILPVDGLLFVKKPVNSKEV